MHWFPLYPSDFIGATVGLSCQEVSTYSWMLTLYYELGPFPVEKIRTYRIVRCESDEQKRTVDFILSEFFVQREDGWYQERAEQERVKQAQVHKLAVESGKRSALARLTKYGTSQPQKKEFFEAPSEGSSNDPPKVSRTSPELTTTTTTKEEKKKDSRLTAPDDVPEQIWKDWMVIRKAKHQPITETGLQGIRREAKKASLSLEAALRISVERGWAGFKASWLEKEPATADAPWKGAINL